jgi:transposase
MGGLGLLFVGDDWSEEYHDVELQDESGRRLGKAKLDEGIAGVAGLHAMIGEHLDADATPEEVMIGIETDRGPWVRALIAAGYHVYAINPLQVARYRETDSTSGARATPLTPTPWPIWCAPSGTRCGPSPATATTPRRSRW